METAVYRRSASGLTVGAHVFGILGIILMLVWLLHFREGIEYDSDNPARVFNVHPFLMFCGFIFLVGQAMMAYKSVPASREAQKAVHMVLNLVGIALGITGICAAFRFHDMVNAEDMYSLHSWIGLTTFCLVGLQWLLGFFTYMFPKASHGTRGNMMAWHISGGRALLYMAICAALTGLMEKYSILRLQGYGEARLVNFIGLCILLFGIFVDLSVALAHHA
ncbi:Probable transmembrane ascorbate ferrireductase 3 [Linum grandiflorum]